MSEDHTNDGADMFDIDNFVKDDETENPITDAVFTSNKKKSHWKPSSPPSPFAAG
jgi:hypothetical protein